MLFRLIEQYLARLLSFYYFFCFFIFIFSSSCTRLRFVVVSVFFLYIFAQNAYLYTQHIFIYSINVFVLHFYLYLFAVLRTKKNKYYCIIYDMLSRHRTEYWNECTMRVTIRCVEDRKVCVYMFTECLCLILIGSKLIQHPTTYIKVLSRIHTHFWFFFSLQSFIFHPFVSFLFHTQHFICNHNQCTCLRLNMNTTPIP